MSGRSTPADASYSLTGPRSRPARRPSPFPPPPLPVPSSLRPPPLVTGFVPGLDPRLVPSAPRPPRIVASPPPPQIRSKSRYNRTCSTESRPRRRAMHDHGAPQIPTDVTRRVALRIAAAFLATLTGPANAAQKGKEKAKQAGRASFEQWVESFKPRALARGVSEATYA